MHTSKPPSRTNRIPRFAGRAEPPSMNREHGNVLFAAAPFDQKSSILNFRFLWQPLRPTLTAMAMYLP